MLLHPSRKRALRHIRSQEPHVKPGPLEHVGDHPQPEHVMLAMHRRDHDRIALTRRLT